MSYKDINERSVDPQSVTERTDLTYDQKTIVYRLRIDFIKKDIAEHLAQFEKTKDEKFLLFAFAYLKEGEQCLAERQRVLHNRGMLLAHKKIDIHKQQRVLEEGIVEVTKGKKIKPPDKRATQAMGDGKDFCKKCGCKISGEEFEDLRSEINKELCYGCE